MVSWGTTANVSLPADDVDHPPAGAAVSVGALGGWLFECGLSAAGAAMGWLAALCGAQESALYEAAAGSPPGARGLTATAWIDGARAPWWESEARGAFAGLTSAHGQGDMARALIEAIAFDVARCIELLGGAPSIAAAGGGGAAEPWLSILAAATGCVVECRRPELAASAGALLVAGAALDRRIDLDAINPVTSRFEPDGALAAAYRPVRAQSDQVTAAVLGLPH
jgi:xylulokinase